MSDRRSIVIAPDKFKGALRAAEVAAAIERGLRRAWGDRYAFVAIPMADGGEGTVDAFLEAGALAMTTRVHGPLGEPVDAVFALDGDVAIIEMASASGLARVDPRRLDARRASSFGTGELVRAALDGGARRIIVGLGGSATSDGGAGMLAALGARFIDGAGDELEPGGAALAGLATLDLNALDERLTKVTFEVAADVDNPLCGPDGAAASFGAQKGASTHDRCELDAALAHFADVTARHTRRDRRDELGVGAAGGLGFAFASYLNAGLRPGVEIVAELRGLPAALQAAALCCTGEGRIDSQTLHGKTVAGVGALARACAVPVIAFAGTLDAGCEDDLARGGIRCFPISTGPMTLAAAMAQSARLIEDAAARSARLLTTLPARFAGAPPWVE